MVNAARAPTPGPIVSSFTGFAAGRNWPMSVGRLRWSALPARLASSTGDGSQARCRKWATRWRRWAVWLPAMVSFAGRSWSVAAVKVGRWLAFCNDYPEIVEGLSREAASAGRCRAGRFVRGQARSNGHRGWWRGQFVAAVGTEQGQFEVRLRRGLKFQADFAAARACRLQVKREAADAVMAITQLGEGRRLEALAPVGIQVGRRYTGVCHGPRRSGARQSRESRSVRPARNSGGRGRSRRGWMHGSPFAWPRGTAWVRSPPMQTVA